MRDLVSRAIAEAVAAHAGQVDKQGKPYILHPLRVMCALGPNEEPEVQAAAVLHDVVEDCGVTVEDLWTMFGPGVAAMVEIVSRPDGEKYADFIERIASSGNTGAIRIKLADLDDNTRPDRALPGDGLRRRYEAAKARLQNARGGPRE